MVGVSLLGNERHRREHSRIAEAEGWIMNKLNLLAQTGLAALCLQHLGVSAQTGATEELAKQLQNPIADLVSVPIQYNYDQDLGFNDDGDRHLINIQPVVPVDLNDDWLVISRTILPVISQEDVSAPGRSDSGTGDVVQSLFFSPKKPADSGWIWGAGPVFLLPTATEDELGAEKWGIGPSAVALKQESGWTYGMLVNHIWDVAGDGDRSDVNQTFVQPFLGYTWPSALSVFLNSESSIDWENNLELVPLNLVVSQVIPLGGEIFSVGAGVRYYLDSPSGGPEGLGLRLVLTWLIPDG